MKTVQKILSEAKINGIGVELYTSNGYEFADALHTDTCEYVGDEADLLRIEEDRILDWGVISPEDYNHTINANCGCIQEEPVVVVVVREVA